jgi:amino acid adenylation domain-containing protein
MMLEDSCPTCVITQHKFSQNFTEYSDQVIILDSPAAEISTQPSSNLDLSIRPTDSIYAIYTSGSTGVPKAAVNTHEAVANRIYWMQKQYQLRAEDRVLQKTPYSFDVSVWEFFWPLVAGATLVIAEPGGHRDPIYLANLIGQENITTIHFVPSMLREFLEACNLDSCSSLIRVFASGEALPPDLCRKFQERLPAELHNLYGPTEAAVDVTYWDCDKETPAATIPIGRPISNVKTYVLDRYLAPVPIGVAGELHIGGVAVARGYLNRPDLTAERFIPDPFSTNANARLYKTGDRARYLPDGTIEYLGRFDNQVKLRGLRIELGEIEAALLESGLVTAAAVVPIKDGNGDECLVGYCVPKIAGLEIAELRTLLTQRLPEYMIPSAFVPLDALPKTPSGKLDRKALPAPETCRDEQRTFVPPEDQIEERLVSLWEDVLGSHPISIHDNYFAIGGHSLLALRLFSQINLSFQLELPLATLFYAPTVRSMAAIIRDSSLDRTASPIVPIQPKGSRRPIFCIGPLQGEVIMFRPLALELGPEQPLYGLQPFDLPEHPLTVEGLASSYIQELKKWGESEPFCVVGYSFGGMVAVEMAQQLVKNGAEPPIVVLIDSSYLAGCKARETWTQRIRRYRYHLHKIAQGADGLAHIADVLQHRTFGMMHKVSHAVNVNLPKTVSQTARLQLLAGERFRANRYSSPVYLIKAESRPEFFDQPDLGWGEVISDLRIRDIPGDHGTIMTGMNVKLMASKLKTILEKIPEAAESPSCAGVI